MKALGKVGLVGAGYISAFAIATAVVAVYIAATQGPDRRDYAAMFDSVSPPSFQPARRFSFSGPIAGSGACSPSLPW
jgi:hypothetical protein